MFDLNINYLYKYKDFLNVDIKCNPFSKLLSIGLNFNNSFDYYSPYLKYNKNINKTKFKNKLNNNYNLFASLTSQLINNTNNNFIDSDNVTIDDNIKANNKNLILNDNQINKREITELLTNDRSNKYEIISEFDTLTIKKLKIERLIKKLEYQYILIKNKNQL